MNIFNWLEKIIYFLHAAFDGLPLGGLGEIMARSLTSDLSDIDAVLMPDEAMLRDYGVRGKDFIVSCSFDGSSCTHECVEPIGRVGTFLIWP